MNQLKVNRQQSIIGLYQQGWSKRRIARELQMDRATVRKYLAEGSSKSPTPHIGSGPEESSKSPTPQTGSTTSGNALSSCEPWRSQIEQALFDDPDFLQRYIDRWAELRTNVFSTSNLFALVDQIASQASPAFQRNAQRWEAGWTDATLRAKAGVSHAAEVEDLKRWIRGRLAWIDSQEFPKPNLSVAPIGDTRMNQISMSCLLGRIFFTTNRSDPRLRGGSPSPQALEYTQPIALTNGVVVTARVKSDFGLWSAPVIIHRE
jgi:hypothetical protein